MMRVRMWLYSDIDIALEFIGYLVLAYAVAFIGYLFVEKPIMNLEFLFMPARARHAKQASIATQTTPDPTKTHEARA
jgi:peptidoglycan/LPS O-acetylase OafA/YrhL